jgi:hypothetical protein
MNCASHWSIRLLSLTMLLTIGASGCSWQHTAEKTLPPTNPGRDDVQYFPAGPEDKLFNQRRAIEEYIAAQAAAEAAHSDREESSDGTDE